MKKEGAQLATVPVKAKNAGLGVVLVPGGGGRPRLRSALTAQRWEVYEADGGAAALLLMERTHPHATLLDGPLPDLHLEDFADEVRSSHPTMDLMALDGALAGLRQALRSPRGWALRHCWRLSCSAMAAGPLPGQCSGGRDGLRRQMGARCFWMRSGRCPLRCSPSCCASWRAANCSGSEKTRLCG